MSVTPAATPWRYFLAGASFGAALIAAGVYSPAIIIGQMELNNFHMLKAFLNASLSSSVIIFILSEIIHVPGYPRSPKIQRFTTWDGNVLGGLLLGAGMALSGACPGTLLPQVATFVPSGIPTFLGALLGGIVVSKVVNTSGDYTHLRPETNDRTIYGVLPIDKWAAIIYYVIVCYGIGKGVDYFKLGQEEGNSLTEPFTGGILIGATQGISLLLIGSTLGVSLAYEEVGNLFWRAFYTPTALEPTNDISNYSSMYSVLGIAVGSYALSQIVELPAGNEIEISWLRAALGGFSIIFGARVAGGCTSGHGISGMSMLSLESMVTTVMIFVGGIGTAYLLIGLDKLL